ncbi:TetR/AcrR family transcriptional regulator [Actinomadura viridis]|uniref:TetR/AcrR family transcriptional regulator n=1 Tax=Actinomadura viridis TaxID=58110 RepID=UPI0036BE077E
MAAARTSPEPTSPEPRRDVSRGRIDKREAILDAAFTVFARQGYAQACVKEIAAEAGVAKPTVYNHLNDKATLFREAMVAAAERVVAEDLAAVEALAVPDDDLRARLEDAGHRLLQAHCRERSRALRRLLHAEGARFPEPLEVVRGRGAGRVTEALAGRLARLILAGRLRAADPETAAEQFLALLTGPMEARTAMGARAVPDDELRALTRAAVDTFLRAFGPETGDEAPGTLEARSAEARSTEARSTEAGSAAAR